MDFPALKIVLSSVGIRLRLNVIKKTHCFTKVIKETIIHTFAEKIAIANICANIARKSNILYRISDIFTFSIIQ